jgi:phage baseplate assembly protein W
MPQQNNRDYLGIGWRFPLQVNAAGRIAQSRYERRVEEGIYLVLATAKGERPMLPEFGCGIHDLVFAPNDSATIALASRSVRQALTAWEPRIDVLDIDVDNPVEQPNLLLIRVSYRIRANNSMGNLVYPFYIREAR